MASAETSTTEVTLTLPDATLEGFLALPAEATGIVVFAHGSGSSRFSSRNRAVAEYLNESGLGTLLFDLLTADEHQVDQQTRELRFDIPLLSRRLGGAVQWLEEREDTRQLSVGLFGSSTGAAAALIAAAANPERVAAVVSRGGRPDLAGDSLGKVKAPTLLIVGGRDTQVIEMNREAAERLTCYHRIGIVKGATHLFEEPGTLEQVEQLAADWFNQYLQ
ncbi:hydrolase [Kineobactrum sediminis]|uniref:Hydrolase n=1 Tax=Kineobactrum sediminis TaxID=1905677 RepID=A0A2N5XY39_9GAMM|nr:alpha/beta family hydrolase [Kineobactrum sediminis]PLW81064.1 hydrolase [Kineobactrum sediminis]